MLRQEEVLLFHRSCSKRLSFGDLSTHYFHCMTVVRRRRNTYEAIQDLNSNWFGEEEALERLVTNYLSNLLLIT